MTFKEIFIIKIRSLLYYVFKYPYYKIIFKNIGTRTQIYSLIRLEYPKNIYLGNRVTIGNLAWLAASPHIIDSPLLKIGDNCLIGDSNEFYCIKEIILESSVFTSKNVYISDATHKYQDISIPIVKQEIALTGTVRIGEGTWLGLNVCVLGANIGKHCVIGANSVVNKSIPDYCVAVGSPAKIVKRFDFETNKWRKTNSIGIFIDE